MHSRSPSTSAYERMNPGQQQQVGGAMTADHFHIKVGSGPATKRVNTTGRLCSRNHASSSWFTSIVSRASGTSSGAPTRTKSFCMSTTVRADLSRRSSNGTGAPLLMSDLKQTANNLEDG